MEANWAPGRRRLVTISIFTFLVVFALIGTVRAQIGGGLGPGGGLGGGGVAGGGFGGVGGRLLNVNVKWLDH